MAQTSVRQGRRRSDCDPISYEDILIAKYLEELRKSEPTMKPETPVEKSPYSQRLYSTPQPLPPGPPRRRRAQSSLSSRPSRPSSAVTMTTSPSTSSLGECVVSTTTGRKYRPFSATGGGRDGGKQKIDAKFIDDHERWEAVTPSEGRSGRPFSAPAHKRPISAMYSSRPASAKSVAYTRKVRSLYRQRPQTLTVTAFKNGTREGCIRVAAPNVRSLLEACTEKLGLAQAARRAFLEDGTELTDETNVPRDADVYISTGDAFRSPVKDIKHNVEASQASQWTMNGLVFAQPVKSKPPKSKMSKRFRGLLEKSRRRVLVFANGNGSRAVEIVTDPEKLDDFIAACTTKLNLGSFGRVLYDWNGKEVTKLDEAPVLDQCLQTWTTPVLGPLWLSRGEGFSPKGVKEFLVGLIAFTRTKLKDARHYRQQLQLAQGENTKVKVEVVALLSMSVKEINDALAMVSRDIDDFSNALNRLQAQMDSLADRLSQEEGERSGYTMKHIKHYTMDDKLVGLKGLRLKVYENGSYEDSNIIHFNRMQAMRSAADKDQLLQRLLDECGSMSSLAYPKRSPAIGAVPRKIFDGQGHEVKDVAELVYDQEIWLSFGEHWKNPFTFALSVKYDKVLTIELEDSQTHDSVRKAVREQLMADEIAAFDGKEIKWDPVKGLPDDATRRIITDRSRVDEKELAMTLLESAEIDPDSWFLQNKEKPQLILYGEPVVEIKSRKTQADGWPPETQVWVISKNGYIYSKAMPQLVLGIGGAKLSGHLSHPHLGRAEVKVEGVTVEMQRKTHAIGQRWSFTPAGEIVSQEYSDYVLTYLGSKYGSDENQVKNEEEGVRSGQRFYIAACSRLDKHKKSQRWAVKQERLDNIGQWKKTDVENPEWNKQAFSWPVKRDGSLNEEYDWPMEGYLLPYAPPMNSNSSDNAAKDFAPLRLQVVRNGVKDKSKAVAVVAPDLSLAKQTKASHGHGYGKSKGRKRVSGRSGGGSRASLGDSNVDTESMDDNTLQAILKKEFEMFLDRCTQQLDLSFPARRLFDDAGQEHFNLGALSRDQLVSVTCGEPWSDPKLSKAEQQRRFLLANLAGDLTQIRHYIATRSPNHLVLEVESSLAAGSRLIIGESAALNDGASNTTSKTDEMSQSLDGLFGTTEKSSHAASHARADEKAKNHPKWPWEKLINSGMDESIDGSTHDQSALLHASVSSVRSRRRGQTTDSSRASLQRFVYEDGYVACEADRSLVLGLQGEVGGAGGEGRVVLVKRRVDDIGQRWMIKGNGLIQPKQNSSLVLAVMMDKGPRSADDDNMSYVGCAVALQRMKVVQVGRANQRWSYDAATNQIFAFDTTAVDKEVTAANQCSVCTFAVLGKTEIDQPGYMVEMPAEKGTVDRKRIIVCTSCARAMRGRYKLKRLDETSVDFYCAMGCAKEYGLQQVGSFKCLNGKVDLSEYEAEPTLRAWEQHLSKLRAELSVRSVARRITAAAAPYTVRLRAHRNGEGRTGRHSDVIVGSSVVGILKQATEKLGLTQAARRLYTADGTLILDLDDLIEWVKDAYVREGMRRLREEKQIKGIIEIPEESDEEEDEEQESAKGQEVRSEFTIGYVPSGSRQYIDEESSCIIIPNPNEPITEDGTLVAWQLFAKHSGMIALDVFRPTGDPASFVLIGQSVCELAEGELMIDISGKPLAVETGDVIGFHIINKAIIPYDVVPDEPVPFHYLMTEKNPTINGLPITMETSQEEGIRAYSLMAKIISHETTVLEPAGEQISEKKTKKISQLDKKSRTEGERKGKGLGGSGRPSVEPPPLDVILRHPIEIFVSCGEDFIRPEQAQEHLEAEQEQRGRVAGVAYELSKEKHVLRQMRGRRLEDPRPLGAPALGGTQGGAQGDPGRLALVDGRWQEVGVDERQKYDIIHHLQTHLKAMKVKQKPKGVKECNPTTTQRLYPQPKTKRLLIFSNGDKVESAQYVWGETMAQLLDNSTTRLHFTTPARYLFTMDGQIVDDFDHLEKDQILCASTRRNFVAPEESQQMIEVKATWSRMNRAYGRQSTDIVVETRKAYQINNDYICSRTAPQLVLTLMAQDVRGRPGHPLLGQSDVEVSGLAVSLQPKSDGTEQKWNFTEDGYVCNKERPDLVLTYLGAGSSGDEDMRPGSSAARQGYSIAACPRLDLEINPFQRSSELLNGSGGGNEDDVKF